MVDDQLSSYERDCLDKQHKLVSTVRDNIARYKRNIQRAITMQRTFVVATMILGVVAPILVARGGPNGGLFGLSPGVTNMIALVVTALLSIMEGVRRIYRFEQRWMSSYSAMKTMKFALDRFDYALPGTTPGSEPWQEAMETLRSKYESAKETERSDFFDTLSALEPKEEEHKKPGAS